MTLESPLLSAIPGLRHAFFTREGGVSGGIYGSLNGGVGSNDDPAHVEENRRRMAEQLGVSPAHFLSLWQTHSPDVVVASGPWQGGSRPRADAIVTRTEGLAIGATAADCGPILFVDPGARVIGAAHAGWKGALTGILESTIDAMEKLGAERERHRRRHRPADPPALLRSRRRIRRTLHRGRRRERAVLHSLGARRAMRCSTSPASSGCGSKRRACS